METLNVLFEDETIFLWEDARMRSHSDSLSPVIIVN